MCWVLKKFLFSHSSDFYHLPFPFRFHIYSLIVLGGGLSFTFLRAIGVNVGNSLGSFYFDFHILNDDNYCFDKLKWLCLCFYNFKFVTCYLVEEDLIDEAMMILEMVEEQNKQIVLPIGFLFKITFLCSIMCDCDFSLFWWGH